MSVVVDTVVAAMLDRREVRVRTASREFAGRVYEVGMSPYDEHVRARVVDRGGRVHYFRVTGGDVRMVFATLPGLAA